MSQVRTPLNFLLMNMIMSELVIACFGVPIDMYAATQHGWTLGEDICILTGFVLTTTGKSGVNSWDLSRVQNSPQICFW